MVKRKQVKTTVKNKVIFTIVLFMVLIAVGILLVNDYVKAQGGNINIEVLIDGVDDIPKIGRIGEPIKLEEYIEMWHHSGGYWSYEDIKIYDTDLNFDLTDEDALADKIKGEFVIERELDSKIYEKLIKAEDLKVVCSTTLKNPVTDEYKIIYDIFYEKPSIELKNGKIYFKGKPKLNFYKRDEINFEYIIGDTLDIQIPFVDPDYYGMNLYAIWSRKSGGNKSVGLGGAWGYFNKADPFATPNVPTIDEIKHLVNIPNIENYSHILDIPNIDKTLKYQYRNLEQLPLHK